MGDIRVEDCEDLHALLDRLDAEEYVSAEEAEAQLLEAEREANRARAAAQKAARRLQKKT